LEQRESPSASEKGQDLVLATWETDFQPAQLIDPLHDAGVLARYEEVTPIVSRLQQNGVGNSMERVVLFTDKPSLAVFHFALRPRVRTAWVVDHESLASSVDYLDANVLVIEPSRHTLSQLVELIGQYAVSRCKCPASTASRIAQHTS
jgi:hypothetical protein